MSIDVDTDLQLPESGMAPRQTRRRILRRLVSVWLVFHIAAIIISPAAVGPSSETIREAWGWFQPYVEFMYLDHGYHFFAPEPAESTLLAYVAHRPDGTEVRGRIPDRTTSPRLLYHRYFMLTEHMKDAPDEVKDLWYASYANHIGWKHGASEVTLIQQTHNLPTMERVRDRRAPERSGELRRAVPGDFPMRRLLNPIFRYLADMARATAESWDTFWFTPADPTLLGMLRVLTGLMLLYTHAVWGLVLGDFFGPRSWLSEELIRSLQEGGYDCSFWWLIPSDWMWPAYGISMVVLALFTVGLWTQVTSILAFVVTVSFAHRVPVAVVRPGPDQRHADSVSCDRGEWTGDLGRSLAGHPSRSNRVLGSASERTARTWLSG